ncbi:hypothetical protein Tco_0027423 [Tanacetum coccineum]|uniref:RING-type E3 ubiquitin transferase n=1 Tax=Tanacetum coccineum TaxID=301880 RepID=A0ABQ4ZM19_9ASTR
MNIGLIFDNMSYEELLALEERIGNVNNGLARKHFNGYEAKHICDGRRSATEACCICQGSWRLTERRWDDEMAWKNRSSDGRGGAWAGVRVGGDVCAGLELGSSFPGGSFFEGGIGVVLQWTALRVLPSTVRGLCWHSLGIWGLLGLKLAREGLKGTMAAGRHGPYSSVWSILPWVFVIVGGR